MIKALGIILLCSSPLAESCQVLTSPTVFDSKEECQESTLNFSLFLRDSYSPAHLLPMCVDLKLNGEPA